MSALEGRTDMPFKWRHFRFCAHLGHLAGSNLRSTSAIPYCVIDTLILLKVVAIASIEVCDASVVSF
jgi:hypothetical protein